jgi:flagellar biosynthetic protein FliO
MANRQGRMGVVAVLFSLLLASNSPAQSESSGFDARRTLQIPPQDILKLCKEPEPLPARSAETVVSPSSRPASPALLVSPPRSDLTGSERRDPGSWPVASEAGSSSKESRLIARPTGVERANPAHRVRESESSDVARRAGTAAWSWRDLWPLLSVLALIALLAWIVKRALPARRLSGGSGVMEVLSRTPLSGKQSLVLVKMGRRLLLLGVSGDQINTLCIVDDPGQVATLIGAAAGGQPGSMTQAFARAFADENRVYDAEPTDEPESEIDAGGEVRSLLDKVRHLSARRNVA